MHRQPPKPQASGFLKQIRPGRNHQHRNLRPFPHSLAPERWVDDALFRPEVRDAFHRLTAQGWTDALRALHPGERVYTFWKFFRNAYARNAGLRIDHLLLSPSLAGRLVAAEVAREVRGWEKPRDPAPAWVELADAKKKRGR